MNSGERITLEQQDAFEAFTILRRAKNFFALLLLLSLAALQGVFWVVNAGLADVALPVLNAPEAADDLLESTLISYPPLRLTQAQGTQDAVSPAEDQADEGGPQDQPSDSKTDLKIVSGDQVRASARWWQMLAEALVGAGVYVGFFTGMLLTLSLGLMLAVALIGRLGELGHLTKALLYALILGLILAPWQELGGVPYVKGVLFTWPELAQAYRETPADLLEQIGFYTRFAGLNVIAGFLLLGSLLSSRSAALTIRARLHSPLLLAQPPVPSRHGQLQI